MKTYAIGLARYVFPMFVTLIVLWAFGRFAGAYCSEPYAVGVGAAVLTLYVEREMERRRQ